MISVIVPIYNAKRFLDKGLNNIVGQSYGCLEIILIDDGSQDASLQICYRHAQIDKRIKVFSQVNSGLSYASGEYIIFVDSDDYSSISDEEYQCLTKNEAVVSSRIRNGEFLKSIIKSFHNYYAADC